jgi:hypothetical protein
MLNSIHLVVGAGKQRTLALQWRTDDRKAPLERFAQLVVRHFHREIDGTVAARY